MSNARDPRTDPRVGDVLRGGELIRAFEVTARHDHGCSVNQSKPFRPKRIFVPAAAWIKWAATAEVIERGIA